MRSAAAALAVALASVTAPALAQPVTVASCFREVTFEDVPERPIVNDLNMTLIDMGLLDPFVGVAGLMSLADTLVAPPEVIEEVEAKVFSPDYPSLEAILGQSPDFYFAGWNFGLGEETGVTPAGLEDFGIQTYELYESCIHVGPRPPISMETIYTDVLALGRIFRVEGRAEEVVADSRRRVDAVTSRLADVIDRPRVMYCTWQCHSDEPPMVIGAEGIPRTLMELAGGENIFNDLDTSYIRVGWEEVIDRDPEWLVISPDETSPEDVITYLTTNPSLQNVSAVRDRHFIFFAHPYIQPSTRNVDAVEIMARAMFPDRFAD